MCYCNAVLQEVAKLSKVWKRLFSLITTLRAYIHFVVSHWEFKPIEYSL